MYLYTPIFKIFGRFLPQFQLENKNFWLFFFSFWPNFYVYFYFFYFLAPISILKQDKYFLPFLRQFWLTKSNFTNSLGNCPNFGFKNQIFCPHFGHWFFAYFFALMLIFKKNSAYLFAIFCPNFAFKMYFFAPIST